MLRAVFRVETYSQRELAGTDHLNTMLCRASRNIIDHSIVCSGDKDRQYVHNSKMFLSIGIIRLDFNLLISIL